MTNITIPSLSSILNALSTVAATPTDYAWKRQGSGSVATKPQKNLGAAAAVSCGAVRCVTCGGAVVAYGQGPINTTAVIGHILVPAKVLGQKGAAPSPIADLYGIASTLSLIHI